MNAHEPIFKRLAENQRLTDNFYKVENRILSVLNYRDFFDVLLSDIKSIFNIPHVWVTFYEDTEVKEILISCGFAFDQYQGILFKDRTIFEKILGKDRNAPMLFSKELDFLKVIKPADLTESISSLAVSPVSIDGEVIGNLIFADESASRFKPGMDTFFLKQLALKASICLSNVTAHEKLKFLAYHDPLTGLLNRRVMTQVLSREFERSIRYDNDMSVVFVDLDGFKEINDTHGHDTGDRLLVHFGNILKRFSRNSDIVARFAGDEFVLILPETGRAKAGDFMARIRQICHENPLVEGDENLTVHMSYGICARKDGVTGDCDSMLKEADRLLYVNKRERKGLA